ncbi:YoaK family protein [Sediminibacterium sp.]|uniref:YoaK family protein n=1 Tax=Sediminibacterium sp. TaxID=1917865 RepID=UPI0027363260|nr:YoaK family protein [Sediminibacterium sp.]MDP3392767.1 YoaK family protein [Sediminibacterium sp.]MDP3565889.1 YoaK family protein [Sediminibacterium sp.]
MFRHRIGKRSLETSIALASFLSCVAGMVNVVGFLAIQKLTTNVTGHFAFFIEAFDQLKFWEGLIYIYYVIFFLLGAFVSNTIIEIVYRKAKRYAFSIPILLEITLLVCAGLFLHPFIHTYPDFIAFILLFTMGLQNALVTKISSSVIRTTHLTGLFTDLGIELSQLFFYNSSEQKKQLTDSIKLKFTIIFSFFIGGIIAGLFYNTFALKTLIIAAAILFVGLIWKNIKLLFYDYRTIKK